MTTNAQAALAAAATIHTGSKGYANDGPILEMAGRFKVWLDLQDESDQAREAATAKGKRVRQ